jgi:hypothetical protein
MEDLKDDVLYLRFQLSSLAEKRLACAARANQDIFPLATFGPATSAKGLTRSGRSD